MQTRLINPKILIASLGVVAASSWAIAKGVSSADSGDIHGVVKLLLLNPEGDADGLLLENGDQIHFPPHMSRELVATVSPQDHVEVRGEREAAHVFRAASIMNEKTKKKVVESPPPPPPGRPPGPPDARGPLAHENLKQLSADAKVIAQLYGPRGEVNGVILADHTVVRFGPRLREDSRAKLDVGEKLKVSGFGSESDLGRAIEATQLVND